MGLPDRLGGMLTKESPARQVVGADIVRAVLVVGGAALIGALVGLVGLSPQVWAGGIGLILAIGVALLRYRVAFEGFCFIFFALFDFIGYVPLLSASIKIYLADGIILLMAVLCLRALSNRESMRSLASPVTGLLVINFFFGFFALLVGFGSGHQFNDVVGDFRRFFFYPLATLAALGYILRRTDIRKLILLFSVVLLVISGIALVRVAKGQTWDPAQFAEKGDFRAIGYFTGVIVVMGLGVFYGFSLVSRGYRKWASVLASGLLIGVGFLSGYRLLWALLVMTPLFVSWTAYRGQRRNLRLILALLITAALLIGALVVAQYLFADRFLLMKTKFQERVLGFSFQDNIRYVAWKAAWNRFASSPIIGAGIGDQFSFWGINSAGNPHLFRLTTHNVFLAILYQTGVLGGGIFLVIHLRIVWYVWTRLPQIEPCIRAPLTGMLSGYLAALALGMFQPLFESPGAIVGFYLWLGMMLNVLRLYLGDTVGTPELL